MGGTDKKNVEIITLGKLHWKVGVGTLKTTSKLNDEKPTGNKIVKSSPKYKATCAVRISAVPAAAQTKVPQKFAAMLLWSFPRLVWSFTRLEDK